jgi:hypothetical protein
VVGDQGQRRVVGRARSPCQLGSRTPGFGRTCPPGEGEQVRICHSGLRSRDGCSGTRTCLGRALSGAVLSLPLGPRPVSLRATRTEHRGGAGARPLHAARALRLVARGLIVWPLTSPALGGYDGEVLPVRFGLRRRRDTGLRLVSRRRFFVVALPQRRHPCLGAEPCEGLVDRRLGHARGDR